MRVAIIPARGGSTRIPRKNIRPFHGRPIIEYPIAAAMASGLFDGGIWVSTEDPEIARVAWNAGAKVHPRQVALAQNNVGTQDVIAAALREIWPVEGNTRPDLACCIYPCSPLIMPEDLRLGLDTLLKRETPFAYSVDPTGQDAGQWYWGLVSAFLNNVQLDHPGHGLEYAMDDPRSQRVIIPAERVCDINTYDDWKRAHYLYQAMTEERGR